MKIKKNHIVVTLKGKGYEREDVGDASSFWKTYIGKPLAVWRRISEEHSYGADEEETDVDVIRQQILESNGDGCDGIFFLTVTTPDGKVESLLNEEPLEEEVIEVED